MAKIIKRVIDGLEPGAIVTDSEIRGFVARRLPSGLVSYGFRYRNQATVASARHSRIHHA